MAQITLNSTGVASNGALVLQSNGTTAAVTIDTSQRVAFVAGTAALPAITTTGDPNTGIFFPAADTIAFAEGGVEAVRIDSSGNLGIETTATDPYSLGSGGKTLAMNCTTAGTGTLISMASGGSARGYFYANDTEFRMSAYTAIPIIFKTSDTERARFNSTGALVFAGGTTTANGIGITFPATQSASTNANTLDDYEEGTFTPTVTATSGSNGGGTFTGSYIKIGRFVYVTLGAITVSKGTLSGTIVVGGLPFDVNVINATATCRWELGTGGVPAAGTTIMCPQSSGSTTFEIQQFGNSGYLGLLSAGNLGATFSIYNITYSYITSN